METIDLIQLPGTDYFGNLVYPTLIVPRICWRLATNNPLMSQESEVCVKKVVFYNIIYIKKITNYCNAHSLDYSIQKKR